MNKKDLEAQQCSVSILNKYDLSGSAFYKHICTAFDILYKSINKT